jgi:hypothetical protein
MAGRAIATAIARVVPAISLSMAPPCRLKRDARVKPAHDESKIDAIVVVYSVATWATVSGSGSEKNFCVRKRSTTNSVVSKPPIGIGR